MNVIIAANGNIIATENAEEKFPKNKNRTITIRTIASKSAVETVLIALLTKSERS